MKTFLASILALVFSASSAYADINVDSASSLKRAVERAKSGETIIIAAGRYDLTDLQLPRSVTLKGDGEVVFYSSGEVEKGILNPLWHASLRVENIKFENATAPDLNGAGIRHDGVDLTVINCVFENNEDGILATGQDHGVVTIIGSAFINNGYGDGYSHAIYAAGGTTLEVRASRFVGTRIGHHVKSLANVTTVTGSTFDDADGKTSYSIDATHGGVVTITGNSFMQAADADNNTLINYDATRGGAAESLTITGNRIVNRNKNGRLLRNDTKVIPTVSGNEIINEAGGKLSFD